MAWVRMCNFETSTRNSNMYCTCYIDINHALLLRTWLGAEFVVRFNNFALTAGFYWSYTLLLKPPVLMHSWHLHAHTCTCERVRLTFMKHSHQKTTRTISVYVWLTKTVFAEHEFWENPQNMHAMLKINGLKPDTHKWHQVRVQKYIVGKSA